MAPTSAFTPTSRLLRKREAARIRQRRCRQRKREAALTTQKPSSNDDLSTTKRTSDTTKQPPCDDRTKVILSKKPTVGDDVTTGSVRPPKYQNHDNVSTQELNRPRPMVSCYPNSLPSHRISHPVAYHQQQPAFYRPSSSAWEPYNPPTHHSVRAGNIHYGTNRHQASHPYHGLPPPSLNVVQPHPHGAHHHPSSSYGGPTPLHMQVVAGPPAHHHSSMSTLNNGGHNRQHQPYPAPSYRLTHQQQHQHHPSSLNPGGYLPPISEYPTKSHSAYGSFVESTRTISRSPSASSLETPAPKKLSSNSSSNNSIGEAEEVGEGVVNTPSYTTLFQITETDVKRKSAKSLLSTEKAAVFAMLTLKNNSSDDSDDSTVTSNDTAHLLSRRHHHQHVETSMEGHCEHPIHFSLSTVAATTVTAV